LYKQISPSYFYKFNNIQHNNIKKNIFTEIDKLNTIIIKKDVVIKGGSLTQTILNKTNLKNKKYIIVCSYMNYTKLRLELYDIINSLSNDIDYIIDDISLYKDLKYNKFDNIIDLFKDMQDNITKLHNFSKKYNINDLKYIDFVFNELTGEETNYINDLMDEDSDFNSNLLYYKDNLEKIKINLIDNIDTIKSKILCGKFYNNPEYKLTENEFNFTFLLYYSINSACEVIEREKLGYILKMLLSEYDWKLFRNAFHLFYDDFFNYMGYIKGKYKFVETFDENKYDYQTKIVHNEYYPDEFDLEPIEKFERKNIESKYELIQQYIKEINV
jgi:hypothetical protein